MKISFKSKNYISKRFFGIFKKLVNFQRGDENPVLHIKEHHFIIHNKNFKESLASIQCTDEEKSDFVKVSIRKMISDQPLTTEDVLRPVSRSLDNNPILEQNVKDFCELVLPVIKDLPMKSHCQQKFLLSIENKSDSYFAAIKQESDSQSHLTVLENPYIDEAVHTFAQNLDITWDRLGDILCLLIEFSNFNEILTFLSCNQILAKGLGLKLFLLLYNCLSSPTSFTIFLEKVQMQIQRAVAPIYHFVKINLSFVYKNKFTFTALSSAILFVTLRIINPVLKPIKLLSIPESSSWSPTDESVKTSFEDTKKLVCEPIYMISNLMSNSFVAFRQGVFDAWFSPQARVILEKEVNKIIPAMVKKIEK